MENISLLDVNKPEKVKQVLDEINKKLGQIEYEETDPTVPDHVKSISQEDINKWNEGSGAHEYVDEKLKDYAEIEYVNQRFNGASKPETYDTYLEMITALNAMNGTEIKKGQDIHIVQTGIPDLWVAYIEETSDPYAYIDDDTFVNELLSNGTVQVGYYKLGYLETQKFDPSIYVKKTDYSVRDGNHGLVKISAPFGIDLPNGPTGAIAINMATNEQINGKTNTYRPLVPANFDYAMSTNYLVGESAPTNETKAPFLGALYVDKVNNKTYQCTQIDSTNSTYTWSQLIRSTDYAGNSIKGVVDVRASFGLQTDQYGRIYTVKATEDEIKEKTNDYHLIVPSNLDVAVASVLKNRIVLTKLDDGTYSLDINTEV